MKIETKNREKAMAVFWQLSIQERWHQQVHEILQTGTTALNALTLELGRQAAEFFLYSEREDLAEPDYQPRKDGLSERPSESVSVYVGGQKVATMKRMKSTSTPLHSPDA